ncbi:MAG: tRNA (adenosine(37)-N6)-threonylcarbamoyltransferase complex dimerization subunit type 1 TsaB [Faecousia sp.]
MRILAFETSAKAASVALLEEDCLLAESYQNTGLTHSQTILSMAQNLLTTCGLTPKDVDVVAVAGGPGSFTGIRIGVAAAKGFAWGRELPLYGVSTLESMALSLGASSGILCPVMDARRSQVYNALFRAEGGVLTRLRPDRAISLKELGEDLENFREEVFFVGDGACLCYNTLGISQPRFHLVPEHRRHQRACGVALAALEKIRAGEPGDAAAMEPNYLRLSQAERERLERLQSTNQKGN